MFANWKLGWKLRLVGIAVLACAVVAMLVTEWRSESQMYEHESIRVQHLVETAVALVQHQVEAAKSGELTEEQAKAEAIAQLKSMRYGKDGYFWINDMTPRMIMHPTKPELDGQDLGGMTDPKGHHLFVTFVDVVKAKGVG